MTRRSQLLIAHVIVAMFLAMPVVRGATGTIKDINQGGNTTAPLLIMVIADHYQATTPAQTAAAQAEFDSDVENFFKYGLLIDDYYTTQKTNMRILSYFEATPPGQDSLYGFTIANDAGNCAVKDDPSPVTGTAVKLDATLAGVVGVPSDVHYVVIGNHPYDFGCTSGMWTYVAVDAVGTDVMQHEFGHRLAGLFDEWAMKSNGATPYPKNIPPNDIRNCSTAVAPTMPAWVTNFPTPSDAFDNAPGCDLYSVGVVRPYKNMCRMGATHHRQFCIVCAKAMNEAFLDMKDPERLNRLASGQPGPLNLWASHDSTPPPHFGFVNAAFVVQPVPPPVPAPAPELRRMARLVVEFDPGGGKPTLTIRRRTFVTGVYVPSYRRLGEYLYEIVDTKGTREIGILNDQLLRPRGYRGSGGHHETGAPGPVDIIIAVPDEDEKTFADGTRGLQLVIYKIPPTITNTIINRNVFREVRARLERMAELKLQ
jgi:hypothetical protein